MTEWRALTQGGCLPGSQTFTAVGTFTAPSGVTRVKITTARHVDYFTVTQFSDYTVGRYTSYWTFNGTRLGSAKEQNLLIEWSNTINQS